MQVLQGESLWDEISALSIGCRYRQCAVAYVTNTTAVTFSDGDLLIVDASDESIIEGRTSARELEKLFQLGVELHSCSSLHAKVYIFDKWLVIGSCNLSSRSRSSLIEAALVTNNPQALRGAESAIRAIRSKSLRINRAFIQRILQLPVRISEPPNDEATTTPMGLWRLSIPPVAISPDMKCYFHALIVAQIGNLRPECNFYLWPSSDGKEPFRAHMKTLGNERLVKDGTKYSLTMNGVAHFMKRAKKLDMSKVECFRRAIISGDSTQLPDTILKREMVSLL
jgi:hypothetical protein